MFPSIHQHCLNLLGIFWYKPLEVFPRRRNVHLNDIRGSLLFTCTRHDHHHIGVLREHVDVRRKVGIAHFHTLELRIRLEARDFELLYNVRYSLKTMTIVLLGTELNNRETASMLHKEKHICTKLYLNEVVCDISKNVAFSNRTTSSAPQISQNSRNWDSNCSTFGIIEYTMLDHALYKVSSQIDVANDRILKLANKQRNYKVSQLK